ncbi:hypothetical protein ACVHNB_23745 [Streptomyces sp. YJ-C3]
MSVNGNAPQAARRSPGAVTCPVQVLRPADGGDDAGPRPPAGRTVDRTDSKERAALMAAFALANSGLAQAHAGLGERAADVQRSADRARGALEAVERFEHTRTPGKARQRAEELDAEHAQDGPEDLRRSSRLWRWVLLPLVVLAGMAFDTAFIGTILQALMKVGPHQAAYYLAYLPGLAVPICLLAAGTLLAESWFRHRVTAARGTERTRRRLTREGRRLRLERVTETRERSSLPWPVAGWPLLFTLGILAMSGFWAYTRTVQVGSDRLGFLAAYRPAVVVLLLMLGLATVLAKIMAHNPYAHRAKRIVEGAQEAEKTAADLLAAARNEIARLLTSWSRLKSATLAAEDQAHRALDDACIALVQDRARSGVAGDFAFPLRALAWPWPQEPLSDTAGGTAPPPPRVRMELLEDIHTVLTRCDPERLHEALTNVARRMNTQWNLDAASAAPGTKEAADDPAGPAAPPRQPESANDPQVTEEGT